MRKYTVLSDRIFVWDLIQKVLGELRRFGLEDILECVIFHLQPTRRWRLLTELAQVSSVRLLGQLILFIAAAVGAVTLYVSTQSILWFTGILFTGVIGIVLISGGVSAVKRFSRRLLSPVTKWISRVIEGHLSHALLFLSVIALLVVSALNFSYATGMAIALGFTVFSFAFVRLRGRPPGTR